MNSDAPAQPIKARLLNYYQTHETRVDVGFFLGGVLFDIFTLADIDDTFSILQQVAYLLAIGAVLYWDFLETHTSWKPGPRLSKYWNYRHVAMHFVMGSLLSVYSLFFLKSSSLFTSFVFILCIITLLVANETRTVQKSTFNLKTGLYVVCLFSFFSMMFPVLLGYVGRLPFALASLMTALIIGGVFKLLQKQITDPKLLFRALLAPGLSVVVVFIVFYLLGWIPPVPLSVKSMGVYHKVEKTAQGYELSFEKPWYKFWKTSDTDFVAEPQDRLHFFARIFAPGRFDDAVTLHWMQYDKKRGWLTTDRIPMRITGGRKGGYRGAAVKQNFTPGEWRVQVETTDGREIGRYYFTVERAEIPNPERKFEVQVF